MTVLLLSLLLALADVDVEHVRVTVVPDHAPDGSLWRVAIDGHELQPDADLVYATDIPDGRHELKIWKPDGDIWWKRIVDISPLHRDIPQPLPALRVSGIVSFAGKPIAATVVFGKEDNEHWTFHSDASGHFDGVVQGLHDRVWDVTIDNGRVHRKLEKVWGTYDREDQTFLLDIAKTSLRVHATTRDGKEVPDAVVTAEPHVRELNRVSGPAGKIVSLEAARYVVTAETETSASAEVEVTILEGEEKELTLVLDPMIAIHGRVLCDGQPVTHATVTGRDVTRAGETDGNGEFTVKFRPGTTASELGVWSKTHVALSLPVIVREGAELALEAKKRPEPEGDIIFGIPSIDP